MERTELAEEKGMERRSVSVRAAEDGSSSSIQMVAEAEPVLALDEKQGTIKDQESMGVGEMRLGRGSRRISRREKKVMEKSEQTSKKVLERSMSKAEDETSSSSWMQMAAKAQMLALTLQIIEEVMEESSEEEVEEMEESSEEEVEEMEESSEEQVVEIQRILDDMKQWTRLSIYWVPDWLKSLTKAEAYRPQVVSLGPFHHGEQSLRPMEEHKRRLMMHMVERSKKPLALFNKAIEEVADELREAYDGLDKEWRGVHRDRFVEVMVWDGGFLLEFMTTVTRTRRHTRSLLEAGYAPNDPIFSERSVLSLWPRLRSDMILVENQVPLLALQKLEAVRSGTSPSNAYINKLVTDFICPNPEEIKNQEKLRLHTLEIFHRNFCSQPLKHQDELHHSETTMLWIRFKRRLLHPFEMLHRKFCGGHSQPLKDQDESGQSETTTPSAEEDQDGQSKTTMLSAEELREAGVQFKRSKTRSIQDIDFKNGVLSMPLVEIGDSSERTFLNLMAFERLHCNAGSVATDYMIFMDNIIDSERDVVLLRSKKVLKNFLSSDKAAADLFNILGMGATLTPGSKVGRVQWQVAKHCERPWPKLQASFKHTYLRNPWVFFSAVAAITLLALTILQTIYTVMPFYTKK